MSDTQNKNIKTITIVTRHYPPNKNINGIVANELAKSFIDKGININVICVDSDYIGNNQRSEPYGKLIKIKKQFIGNSKVKRILSLLYENYYLLKLSKKIKSDLIIVTTSPPLIITFASVMLKKKKWAMWSLDLFPEAFKNSNEIKLNTFLYKIIFYFTYKNPPNLLISLGKEQAKNIISKYKKELPTIILPAGVVQRVENDSISSQIPVWYDKNKITIGYLGNVNYPHNPYFIEKGIEWSSKYNINFVLAVYGVQSQRVIDFAKKYNHVSIINNGVLREHMRLIDIHLVSLKTEYTHLCVPSKAVSSISVGSPILFCGSNESDNWQDFKEVAWLIDEEKNFDKQFDNLFKNITFEEINKRKALTKSIFERKQKEVIECTEKIVEFIQ